MSKKKKLIKGKKIKNKKILRVCSMMGILVKIYKITEVDGSVGN